MMITLSMASRNLRVVILYGVGPRVRQVDMAREIKVNNICGSNVDLRPGLSIDLSTFPPCRRVLAQHIKRVNFQVCIWRRALYHFPEIPSPLDNGYIVTEAGKMYHFGSRGTSFRSFSLIS